MFYISSDASWRVTQWTYECLVLQSQRSRPVLRNKNYSTVCEVHNAIVFFFYLHLAVDVSLVHEIASWFLYESQSTSYRSPILKWIITRVPLAPASQYSSTLYCFIKCSKKIHDIVYSALYRLYELECCWDPGQGC